MLVDIYWTRNLVLRHLIFRFIVFHSAILAASSALAYSPANHQKSIVDGAKLCLAEHNLAIPDQILKHIIVGVNEPDRISPSGLQILVQRLEPGSYGKQRDISAIRIAAQSIHASPNPTRRVYTTTPADRQLLSKTIPVPADTLDPDRLDLDVYAYETNLGLRNKMLINASQFLCVSLAHLDDVQSARKFGNMMHMIGDSYSASHVQRSNPVGSEKNCGTEKIEWHFSMDLIAWKLHRPADLKNDDWRFRCLVRHTSDFMKQWMDARNSVQSHLSADKKHTVANSAANRILTSICRKVLREDAATLARPAGGAAAGYSSASGTDNWKILAKKKPDRAIQPVGLTSAEEAEAFYQAVNLRLKRSGHAAQFSYPARDMADLCKALITKEAFPRQLQCTRDEIDWAMEGSPKVGTMWIPARQ